jgi:hypothetical protein
MLFFLVVAKEGIIAVVPWREVEQIVSWSMKKKVER